MGILITHTPDGAVSGVYAEGSPLCPADAVSITAAEFEAIRREPGGFPMFDYVAGAGVVRSARPFVRPDPADAPPPPPSELEDLRAIVEDLLQSRPPTTPAARDAAARLRLKVPE